MKYLTALLLALAFAWVGDARADDVKGMGAMKNNPIVIEGGESPLMSVVFSHKVHKDKGFTCKQCHHDSSSDTPFSSCREECHATPGARERDSMSMFMAFHAKGDRSCYGCHSMLAERSPKSYPSFYGCRPCHSVKMRNAVESMAEGK